MSSRGYFVEVGYVDFDVDQEHDYKIFGPFRTTDAAQKLANRFNKVLERAEEIQSANLSFSVAVRPFYKTSDVKKEIREMAAFLDTYEEEDDE